MPLLLEEVQEGNVAYFNDVSLVNDPEIDRNDDGLNRPGPFLCIQVKGDRSVWIAISSQYRPERLLIQDPWRSGGNDYWRETPAYLIDGLNTYLGPNSSFVRAAAQERSFRPHSRPTVNQVGIAAVVAEVLRQGGPLLP